jgi:carbamoyl-phosphate synthase large subunit
MPCNVLISSAGRRVALIEIWRQALSSLGLPGEVLAADMSRCSAAFHAAKRAFLVPACTNEDFLSCVLEICERERVRVLVPTIDPELPVLAQAVDRFRSIGTTVHISSPATIEIGFDKHRTHEWLTFQGLPTVRQVTVADVLADRARFEPPMILKPARGSGSVGVERVETLLDLERARGGNYVLQSIAPGVEYTVDVLANRAGRCVCAVPRRRIEVRAGEVSKGVSERNEPVRALAREVVERLPGAYGGLNIQIFHDGLTGAAHVIELNPRFGGGYPLAWQAGARFPCWFLEELLGLPSTLHDAWREGLAMLRYDAAVFVDRSEADA